jgi:hypothetical protein
LAVALEIASTKKTWIVFHLGPATRTLVDHDRGLSDAIVSAYWKTVIAKPVEPPGPVSLNRTR